MDWFRMYGEMMDDPKIGTLDDAAFRTWIELLCVACKAESEGNTKLTEGTLSWALRRNATETLQQLLHRGLVTLNETGEIVITNWNKRQKKSDSSTERVKRHREKSKQINDVRACNVTETLAKRDSNGLEKRREEKNREEEKKEKTTRVAALSCSDLVADGVSEEAATEFLALRKQKRSPLTPTAWNGIKREASKAGLSVHDAVTKCIERGWRGFEAEWVMPSPAKPPHTEKFDPVAYVNRNRFPGLK